MYNAKHNNHTCDLSIRQITQWHYDRNLINGASDWSQTPKLFEEFIEVVAAQMPGAEPSAIAQQIFLWTEDLLKKGRIKSVAAEDSADALLDGLGDMMVVQINLLERNKHAVADALDVAYDAIKHRKGKMIDGVFWKEQDLDAQGNPIKK